MATHVFPSVVDSHNEDLKNVAPDLINGMKIYEKGSGYLVGNLAFSEGLSPHKTVRFGNVIGSEGSVIHLFKK